VCGHQILLIKNIQIFYIKNFLTNEIPHRHIKLFFLFIVGDVFEAFRGVYPINLSLYHYKLRNSIVSKNIYHCLMS